jgi:hypothetical protein
LFPALRLPVLDFIERHKVRNFATTCEQDTRTALAALFESSNCGYLCMVLPDRGLHKLLRNTLSCQDVVPGLWYGLLLREDAPQKCGVNVITSTPTAVAGRHCYERDTRVEGYCTYQVFRPSRHGDSLPGSFFDPMVDGLVEREPAGTSAFSHIVPFLQAGCTLLIATLNEPRLYSGSPTYSHPGMHLGVLYNPSLSDWRTKCETGCDHPGALATSAHLTFLHHSQHKAARSVLKEQCNGLDPGECDNSMSTMI